MTIMTVRIPMEGKLVCHSQYHFNVVMIFVSAVHLSAYLNPPPFTWVTEVVRIPNVQWNQLDGAVWIFDKGRSTLNLSNEVYSPANPSMSKLAKLPSSSAKVCKFAPAGVWTHDFQHQSWMLYQFRHKGIDTACNIFFIFINFGIVACMYNRNKCFL